ncbi:SCO7613 C-terminal domain-containing membrane protein [Nonomuraea rubra]|uniref:SCO7613 C-terminal domain-containing membrane protein n=1 Tax=Nonomuraea rubra TaxID=46180 RepID=UPI0034026319
MDWPNCPACGTALAGSVDACPECRLLLHGPAATVYLEASAALSELERRRTELLRRREEALAGMRAAGTATPAKTVAKAAEKTAAEAVETALPGVVPSEVVRTGVGPAGAGPGEAVRTGVARTGVGPAGAGSGEGGQSGDASPDGVLSGGMLGVPAGGAPAAEGGRKPRRDLSHRAVQNLLLLLGGTLLSIAAVVFTLVSWQVPALRALILIVFTVAVLAAPWVLVRRRLVATAETVALLGLVLIPLDGVAVMQVFDGGGGGEGPGPGPLWGHALSAAALGVVWAVYAWRAPLRLPTPVAIALAQAPLPLAALAIGSDMAAGPDGSGSVPGLGRVADSPGLGWVADAPGLAWLAGALVVTAAFDLVLWQVARRARAAAEYVTTAVAGSVAWAGGTGLAAYVTVTANGGLVPLPVSDPGPTLAIVHLMPAMTLVFGVASAVAILWAAATRGRTARLVIAACAALAAVGACCAVPASVVGASWQAAVVAGGGLLVLAAALRLPVRLRDGVRAGGGLVLAVAACWNAHVVIAVAVGPLGWLTSGWGERAGRASDLLAPGVRWDGTGAAPVVMAAVAAGLALVPPRGELWTPGLRRTLCLVTGSLAVLTGAVAAGSPYEVVLGVLVVLAGALLWTAAASTDGYAAPLWLGVYLAGLAMGWAVADREAGVAVAGGSLVVLAGCAVAARPRVVQAVGGAGATLAAAMLVWALSGSGMAAALAMLGVRAGTLVVTRPSRKLAAAVVRARRTSATVALGFLDRLSRLVRPGGRTAAEAAAMGVGLLALAQVLFGAAAVDGMEAPAQVLFGAAAVEGMEALLLAIGAVLAAASAWRRPRGAWRTVAAVEACVLAVLAPLPLSGAVVPALVGPYGWLTHAWAGAAEGAREALSPSGPWQAQPLLMPVLVLAAVAGVLAAWARWGRQAAMGVAGIAFPVAATTLPVVAGVPYWAALAFLVALTAGLALWSAVSRSAAGGASLWTATLAVSWSLADRTATLAVLAAIVVTGVVCAVRGKGSPVTSVAATVTGLAVGAESVAAALSGGLGEADAALVLLLVIVLLSRAATLPVLPSAVAGPLGAAALTLWPVAMVLAQDVARLSLVLAVGGLALAASAGRLEGWRPEDGRLTGGVRAAACAVAGVASGVAILPHVPVWMEVMGFPYAGAGRPWREHFGGWLPHPEVWDVGRPMVAGFGFERVEVVTALGVGVFVVATAVLMARRLRGGVAARSVATVAVPLCLGLVPPAAELVYPWVLVFYGAVLVALTVQAVIGVRAGAAGVMALVAGAHVVAWSLDVEAYTPAVLAGVAVLGAAAAAVARGEAARTGAAATATVAAGGLAAAWSLSAGLSVEQAAFAVLAVATLALLAATRLATLTPPASVPGATAGPSASVPDATARSPASVPDATASLLASVPGATASSLASVPDAAARSAAASVPHTTARPLAARGVWAAIGAEVAGWGLAVAGVVMAGDDQELLDAALACTGLLALGVALRRDRRLAVWPGLGLLQVALWLRLALSGVTAPEAYTVPLTAGALVAAWLARRRDPGISSWTGYGAALALTFLPSVYAAWNDPGLARPLLLGVAAFAATLAGAWARLQAPLILGGAVLVVTAAHEFAPALAELMGQGPRWLPIAVAGAFLLFTGATYEHRLRDLRRIRRLIVRMR